MGGESEAESKEDELEYGVSSIGRFSAKVQIGAKLLCKGAKVRDSTQRGDSIGEPDNWLGTHLQVTGDGHGHREFSTGRSAIGSWHPGSGG